MRHDEERDNTTAIETQSIEADAHADTREVTETWRERMLRLAIATFGPIRSNEPDPAGVQLEAEADNRRPGGELVKSWDDPEDPEHDEIGDAETEYDIEYDDEPEDDGQPSEYEEWQDFMGGDEHYDHSENEMW